MSDRTASPLYPPSMYEPRLTCSHGRNLHHDGEIGYTSLLVVRKRRGKWELLAAIKPGATAETTSPGTLLLPTTRRRCGEPNPWTSLLHLTHTRFGVNSRDWFDFCGKFWEYDVMLPPNRDTDRANDPTSVQNTSLLQDFNRIESTCYLIVASPRHEDIWKRMYRLSRPWSMDETEEWVWCPISRLEKLEIFPRHYISNVDEMVKAMETTLTDAKHYACAKPAILTRLKNKILDSEPYMKLRK